MATGSSRSRAQLLGLRADRRRAARAQRRLLRRALGRSPSCASSAIRDRVVADLSHHGRAVGFFTIVAATCVLGSQSPARRRQRARRARAVDRRHRAVARAHLRDLHASSPSRRRSHRSPRASTAAGCSRSSPRSRSRCSARSSRRTLRRHAPRSLFFCLVDVARRRDALHLDHLAHLLSLHVLPLSRRTSRRPTGSTWAPRRSRRWRARCSSPPRRTRPCSTRSAAVHARLHADVVGDRDLVDPDAAHPRRLAPRRIAASRCATIRCTGARCSRSACTRSAPRACRTPSMRRSSWTSRTASSGSRSRPGSPSPSGWRRTSFAAVEVGGRL